jgi:hypothetical protein
MESEDVPNGKGAQGSRRGSTATRREKPLNGDGILDVVAGWNRPVELGGGESRREVGKA